MVAPCSARAAFIQTGLTLGEGVLGFLRNAQLGWGAQNNSLFVWLQISFRSVVVPEFVDKQNHSHFLHGCGTEGHGCGTGGGLVMGLSSRSGWWLDLSIF